MTPSVKGERRTKAGILLICLLAFAGFNACSAQAGTYPVEECVTQSGIGAADAVFSSGSGSFAHPANCGPGSRMTGLEILPAAGTLGNAGQWQISSPSGLTFLDISLTGQGRGLYGWTPVISVTPTGGSPTSLGVPMDGQTHQASSGSGSFSSVQAALGCASATCLGTGAALTSTNPATNPPTYTAQTVDGSNLLDGVSCVTNTLCVAVDDAGNVVSSTNPGAGTPTYAVTNVDNTVTINSVSCDPTASLCVAVDAVGNALASTNPTAGTPTYTKTLVGNGSVTNISCPTTGLCVAVDPLGRALISTNPGAGTPVWNAATVDNGHALTDVSCPTTGLCVAVDNAGGAVISTNPTAGTPTWTRATIDGTNALTGVSCPTTALCVAVDNAGHSVITQNPTAVTPIWIAATIDGTTALNDVSCGSTTLCVATDKAGNVVTSVDPTNVTPTWNATSVDGSMPAISCTSTPICVAASGPTYVSAEDINFDVQDSVAPTLSLSGGALSGGNKSGKQTLTVSSADVGSGVAKVGVTANGASVGDSEPACTGQVPGFSSKQFQVCSPSVDTNFSLDTSQSPFKNGKNTIQACVNDYAAGSNPNMTCASATMQVKAGCKTSDIVGANKLSGKFSSNGKRKVVRRKAKGAKIVGRLRDSTGQPFPGVSLCVQESTLKGKVLKKTPVFTDNKGHYSYKVAAGRSRKIRVRYTDGIDKLAIDLKYLRK